MKIKDIDILFLDVTTQCNGRCLMCWHSNNDIPNPVELDDAMLNYVRDKLFSQIKVLQLVGGGETFLYSKIETLLQDCKKYNFKTVITSNFSPLTEEQIQIMRDMNVDFVVSLDASYKELQELQRPGCIFENVIQNIKTLVQYGKKIILQVTISAFNFYDMENILQLAEQLGVYGVKFQSVQYLGNLEKPYKFNKPPEDMEYIKKLMAKERKIPYNILLDYYVTSEKNSLDAGYYADKFANLEYCPNTRNTLYIQGGKVLSCCLPDAKVMGDLYKNTLEKIIDNEGFDTFRKNCRCRLVEPIWEK